MNEYIKPDIEHLLKICRERSELEFLYQITKIVAESDSIGESYGYCKDYKKEFFNNAEKHDDGYYSEYLEYCSIEVYEVYLKQIGAYYE